MRRNPAPSSRPAGFPPPSNTGGMGLALGQRGAGHGGEGVEAGQRVAAFHQRAGAGPGQFQVKLPRCSASRARQCSMQRRCPAAAGLDARDLPPRTRPAWRPCSRVSTSRMVPVSPCGRDDRTMASSVHVHLHAARTRHRSCGIFETRSRSIMFAVLRPVLAHLDEQEQMHAAAEQSLPSPCAPVRRWS